jgi:DnaJ-class molecular chaperone
MSWENVIKKPENMVQCGKCNGSGKIYFTKFNSRIKVQCPRCKGRKWVKQKGSAGANA